MTDAATLSQIRVIDTDSHVSEPPDLWTARVPKKWLDDVPRVDLNPETGHHHWRIQDHWLFPVGYYGYAGWKDYPPNTPWEYEDIDPAAWKAPDRLQRMDEHGIYAQVLYPNIIGFESPLIMQLDPQAALACIQAYNDFITEFASAAPHRFIPITMLPFWDLEASVAEMNRCRELGHHGILFANRYDMIGLPAFYEPHWDPILGAAQDLDMSINFHVGFSKVPGGVAGSGAHRLRNEAGFDARKRAQFTALGMMGNGESISNILTSGLCDRFPELKFVSVESGFGYIPYLLDSLDWHWKGYGAHREHPMLPSEYFRRQVYGSFWFERTTLPLLEAYPDNFMFETDFPHPTSLSPGPASPSEVPSVHIEHGFTGVSDELARKVLYENAAKLYHVDGR